MFLLLKIVKTFNMYNPNTVIKMLEERGLNKIDLTSYLGLAPQASLKQVINRNISVGRLEKIADFFGVSVETFFDRVPLNNSVSVSGVRNRVYDFSVGGKSESELQVLKSLLAEKDKRIESLEEIIALLKAAQK